MVYQNASHDPLAQCNVRCASLLKVKKIQNGNENEGVRKKRVGSGLKRERGH